MKNMKIHFVYLSLSLPLCLPLSLLLTLSLFSVFSLPHRVARSKIIKRPKMAISSFNKGQMAIMLPHSLSCSFWLFSAYFLIQLQRYFKIQIKISLPKTYYNSVSFSPSFTDTTLSIYNSFSTSFLSSYIFQS